MIPWIESSGRTQMNNSFLSPWFQWSSLGGSQPAGELVQGPETASFTGLVSCWDCQLSAYTWPLLYGNLVLQSLSHVRFFAIPWTAAHQSSLSFSISQSSLNLMSIELVMPSKPSHPLSPPSPPFLSLSQHQGLFQWVSSSHQVARALELYHQSFQWIFRVDFL